MPESSKKAAVPVATGCRGCGVPKKTKCEPGCPVEAERRVRAGVAH